MSFALINFQFARGVDSCYTQGQGVTTAIHTYRSLTDSASTILAADYFPPYIDGTLDKVFANDTILIIASDEVVMARVLTVSPLTLSSSVFASVVSTTFSSVFSDNIGGVTAPLTFDILKIGRLVTMSCSVLDAGVTQAATTNFYYSLSPLPEEFRPPLLADGYLKKVNSGISLAELQVSGLGQVDMWANPDHSGTFATSSPLSFIGGSISYFTA